MASRLAVVSQHTRSGNQTRSFVSKYLHFHAPIVPIYDSVVSGKLCSRAWYAWSHSMVKDFPTPEKADRTYYRYCVRIALMAQDWKDARLTITPTARNLDVYLYQYDL